MRGARGGGRGAGGEPLAIGGHLWILSQGAKGGGRRVEEGGNRYQTINADHHNIGGLVFLSYLAFHQSDRSAWGQDKVSHPL